MSRWNRHLSALRQAVKALFPNVRRTSASQHAELPSESDSIPASVADAWLCSYPKCGRTWLRFILSNYLNEVYGLGADVDLHTMFQIMSNDVQDPERGLAAYRYADVAEMPRIVVSHTAFDEKFVGKPIVFLIRSVSDAIVSFYFHNSKQWSHWQGDLAGFIRDNEWGLPRLVRYLNSWSPQLAKLPSLVVTYEAMKRDTVSEVQRIIEFLALRNDEDAVRRAVALASVDRMRKLELERPLPGHQYDPQNQDARRVRKAQVGGGMEHLSSLDVAYIAEYCEHEFSPATRRLYEAHGVPVIADKTAAEFARSA